MHCVELAQCPIPLLRINERVLNYSLCVKRLEKAFLRARGGCDASVPYLGFEQERHWPDLQNICHYDWLIID